MSHTPGPWTLNGRTVLGECFTGELRSICDSVRGGDPTQANANARLIAAAPELLEALEQIIGDLPSRRDWLDPEVENVAREAIRKARGAA